MWHEPLILLLATGAAAKPGLASLLRKAGDEMLPGEAEAGGPDRALAATSAAAARTFDAVSWLLRSAEGFCGVTEDAASTAATCSQASQGQWPLAKPGANARHGSMHGKDWLSATLRCQKLCAQCARCRYISISVRHGDCSWFESCDAPAGLLRTVSGFRTALARNATHAAALHRQHSGSPAALRRQWAARGERLAPTGMASLASSRGDVLDRMQQRRGEFRGGLRTSHTLPLPLASAAAGGPLLLLGVISGDAARRRFLRRAWVAQLNAGAVVRVKFVVGAAQPDAAATDVLEIQVPEHQLVTGAREVLPKKFKGLNLMGAWTWTQYAKVTGWLRWSASQPEPLIGKCDEDVLLVPPMLETYATLLCNMSLHAGGREPAQVLAGVFEWYSWAPATLAAKAWGREREPTSLLSGVSLEPDAECGMYTCNCSGSGSGWTFDGWDLSAAAPLKPRESFAARAELRTCVGPQAFARGALKILGAGAVRWLVNSERFISDTRYAAELLGGAPPSGAAAAEAGLSSEAWQARLQSRRDARASRIELSEDAQLGYWLARHPSLHYVHLSQGRAYVDAPRTPPRREAALAQLLVVHKLKTRDFVPTQRRAAQLWRRAKEIKVHSECKEQPPCDPGGICAHQPGQRVCSLYATLARDPRGLNATLDTLAPLAPSQADEFASLT